jgi:hypothetical protein
VRDHVRGGMTALGDALNPVLETWHREVVEGRG